MEGTILTINCSPGTYLRSQHDPQFMENIINNLAEPKLTEAAANDYFSSIIEESPETEETQQNSPEAEDSKEKTIWFDAAVKLLLSLVQSLRPKVGKSLKLKNKKKMWQTIAEKLAEKGYTFTAMQAENKYRGLERTYKRTKSHNNKTGRNRETCPYEKELGDILSNRDSVFPPLLIGCEEGEYILREETSGSAGGNDSDTLLNPPAVGPSVASTSKKRKTKDDEILEKLDNYHEEMMEEIRSGNIEKLAIMRERNEILKQILNKLET